MVEMQHLRLEGYYWIAKIKPGGYRAFVVKE